MKKLKKLLSIVLAVAMVMSLAVSVGATPKYSITIDETEVGTAYSVYKIFDAEYNETAKGYTYTIDADSDFIDFIKSYSNLQTQPYSNAVYFNLTLVEDTGGDYYIVVPTDDFTTGVADFAAALKSEIETNSTKYSADAEGTVTTGTSVTINLDSLGAGYYFVDTTLGSLAFLRTVSDADNQSTITINEKNGIPDAEKEVYDSDSTPTSKDDAAWSDSSNAQIGDTVYFHTTVTDIYKATDLVLHDYMESGLTFDSASDIVSVYLYKNSSDTSPTELTLNTSGSGYTLTVPSSVYYEVSLTETEFDAHKAEGIYFTESGGNYTAVSSTDTYSSPTTYYVKGTFDMTFDYSSVQGVEETAYIVVTYKAVVNDDAEIYTSTGNESNDNTTYVTYGNSSSSEKSTTKTYVYKLNIYKYYNLSNTPYALSGAGFVLYYEVGSDKVYVNTTGSDGSYEVNSANPTGSSADDVTEMFVDSNGELVITGLDADKTYYLVETTTPTGFNPLTSAIKLEIVEYNTAVGADNSNAGKVQVDDEESQGSAVYREKAEVLNSQGENLPETGGIGVTIFYVVGGILILAAAGVIVITKRKAKAEK